jgi:hypothetical protein
MMPSSNPKLFFSPQASHVNQPGFERIQTPLADDAAHDLEAQLRTIGETKPSEIMGDMKPSISELAKLYQERKSRIDRYVEWYSKQSMADKAWMGGLVASISFVVGAWLGAAWAFSSLITGLYAAAVSIIEEHANLTKNRDAFTGEGAQKVEALIDKHVKSFKALEEKLHTLFQSVSEQHTERAEGISILEGNVDTLEGHNLRYTAVIDSLENVAKQFLEHQTGVALTEVELDKLSTEFQLSMDNAKKLCSTLSSLVSSVEQERQHNVVEESQDETDDTPSFNATIARSNEVRSKAGQTLSKLREAAKARKEANAAQEKLHVDASASYNMQ